MNLLKALAAGAVAFGLLAMALPAAAVEASQASATDLPPSQEAVGDWNVSRLTLLTGNSQLETFKVSRDFVAWTVLDGNGQTRSLYAYDGATVKRVAAMSRDQWDRDADNGFFDEVEGNYDLADGLLVWTATDGLDREIWSYDGFRIRQVSDNTYDDRHPVTAKGKTVWTSYPSTTYNLMISDRSGVRRLDSWHVLNYSFAGDYLYWLNRLPQENWFRVFRYDGQSVLAVGKGDDRPLTKYFWADGQGTVAWEYSTKRWEYDKREIFVSKNGGLAIQALQRDVPPNVTRIEDVVDGWVIVNVTDLLQSPIWNRVQLLKANGYQTKYLDRYTSPIKVRAQSASELIRHLVPDTASALTVGDGSKSVDFIRNEHVILDRFDARDSLAAGALLNGGIVVRDGDQVMVIESSVPAGDLKVNGCIAWSEPQDGQVELKSACPTVAVKSGYGYRQLSGRLVKTAGNPAVYLAASDGLRYAIPTEAHFYGWYPDFSTVRTVSADQLAGYQLGGTVLMRPNYRPIKVASSPQVYAVADDGLLRWVTSEQAMTDLYGADWVSLVAVVPEASLVDYRIGEPINYGWQGHLAYAN